jgi:hypothetical protein
MLYRQDFVTQFRIGAVVIRVNTFTAQPPFCAELDHARKEGHNSRMIADLHDTEAPLPPPPMPAQHWPMVRVHHIEHVAVCLAAAAEASRPVQLLSARDGIALHGSAWFLQICRRGATLAPPTPWVCVIDCAHAPGFALAALAAGVDALFSEGMHPDALQRLCAIASSTHQRVQTACSALLDLADDGAAGHLKTFLTTPHLL